VLRQHAAAEAEERCPAGGRPEGRRQPGTGGPVERQPDLLPRVAQPVGPPRVAAHELRQSLGEDALRAGRDPADEPAHPHPEPDRRAAPREVGDGAVVATMDAMCMTLARGTACGPAGDEAPEGDPLLGNGALGVTQPFELGQEREKASDYAKTAATAAKQENRAPPAKSGPERSSEVGKTRLPSSRPISELQVAG
jgi:hypothetical protein